MRFFVFSLLISILPSQLYATTVCKPREQMLVTLTERYKAKKVSSGIMRPFTVMEVWVSRRGADWLIVTTELNGSSCVIAHGEDYTRRDGDRDKAANRATDGVNPIAGMATAPNVIP